MTPDPILILGHQPSILIVDDTPANLQLLSEELQKRGYRTRPVPSGKLALQAALNAPPDLVLLDITMPDMDGFQVCEAIRSHESLRGLPVIFISARNTEADIVRMFAAGGVDYVTKPFRFEEVEARVATHLLLRSAQLELQRYSHRLQELAEPLEPSPALPFHPNVLLVDDHPESLGLLTELLGSRGYQVRPVPSGRLALQAAERLAPDLVLLDIFMPDMDGFEVCRRLKAIPGLEDAPVVFMSAYGTPYDHVAAFRCGGVDYISKPFQAEEVEARVATHLKLAQMRRELESANRDLAAANRELDLFAHTAVHDLRTPLQQLTGLLDLMSLRMAPLEGEATRFMEGMFQAIQRMSKLMEDLLAYSRSGREPLRREPIDLDILVREVVQELEPMTRNPETLWILDPLPRVVGDRNQLRLALENLLGNAVKFTRKVSTPKIEVHALEDACGFLVRDNGAGFDPLGATGLFTPFKRLHSRDDFDGNGLGLAHVQRIIARHGGRVWAEAAPGQGASFRVALPAQASV